MLDLAHLHGVREVRVMRDPSCEVLTVSDLPSADGRTGWPWTVKDDGEVHSETLLPRITVVTPTLNQGQFIEETIRSVLLQGYRNLEYIVMDGGSTDETLKIIKKYEPWISKWYSGEDNGQADALNKGFRSANGTIYAYLNSDDMYSPGALFRVASDFLRDSCPRIHAYPVCQFGNHRESRILESPVRNRSPKAAIVQSAKREEPLDEGREWRGSVLSLIVGDIYLHQPGVFWPSEAYIDAGGFDESYNFILDHEFFVKVLSLGWPLVVHGGDPVALFRLQESSKTMMEYRSDGMSGFSRELWRMVKQCERKLPERERTVARSARLEMAMTKLEKGVDRGELIRTIGANKEILISRRFWGNLLSGLRNKLSI